MMMVMSIYICMYKTVLCGGLFRFFFFKQKTAYEMRISDWSSDVCSSDLAPGAVPGYFVAAHLLVIAGIVDQPVAVDGAGTAGFPNIAAEIGRASCRERVCQYV